MRNCPKCHGMIEDDSKFCYICGTKLFQDRFCVNCGKKNEVEGDLCIYCNNPIDRLVGTNFAEPPFPQNVSQHIPQSVSQNAPSQFFAQNPPGSFSQNLPPQQNPSPSAFPLNSAPAAAPVRTRDGSGGRGRLVGLLIVILFLLLGVIVWQYFSYQKEQETKQRAVSVSQSGITASDASGDSAKNPIGEWKSRYCAINGRNVSAPEGLCRIEIHEDKTLNVFFLGNPYFEGTWEVEGEILRASDSSGKTLSFYNRKTGLAFDLPNGTRIFCDREGEEIPMPQELISPSFEPQLSVLGDWKSLHYVQNGATKTDAQFNMRFTKRLADCEIGGRTYEKCMMGSFLGNNYIFTPYGVLVATLVPGRLVADMGDGRLVYMKARAILEYESVRTAGIQSELTGSWYSVCAEVNGKQLDAANYYRLEVKQKRFDLYSHGDFIGDGNWKIEDNKVVFQEDNRKDSPRLYFNLPAELYDNGVLALHFPQGTTIYLVKSGQFSPFDLSALIQPKEAVKSDLDGNWVLVDYAKGGVRQSAKNWLVGIYGSSVTIEIDQRFKTRSVLKEYDGFLFLYDYYGIHMMTVQDGKMLLDLGDGAHVYLGRR